MLTTNNMYYSCKKCTNSRNINEIRILNCKHSFCLTCIEEYILANMSVNIKCPLSRCYGKVGDTLLREILSSEDIVKYDAMYLKTQPGAHKCILPQCGVINMCPEEAHNYKCKNCSLWNCVSCNSSHFEISCVMYKSLTPRQVHDKYNDHIEKAKEIVFKNFRKSLFDASKMDLTRNDRVFECLLCLRCIAKGEGVMLRNCFHYICKPCLKTYIINANRIPIICPNGSCKCSIEDREVNYLLSKDEYKLYEKKSLDRVRNKISNSYQCQQANCGYFCQFMDDKAVKFKCPKCRTTNCVKCKAVHSGQTCEQYHRRGNSTNLYIEESIKEGKFMSCPNCHTLVSKSRGCNWIKCPTCDLELCWILRMRRWGPKGRGDTSGGCMCSPDKFCHPSCTGCIPDR